MIMNLKPGTQVYLFCSAIDLRKGFNGLAALVSNVLRNDPYSGHLFVFRGKRGDYFKCLYWDGTGLCLFAKRLEEGKFAWPPVTDDCMSLSQGQLMMLIEGIDWRRTVVANAPRQPAFV
jgi:transposase